MWATLTGLCVAVVAGGGCYVIVCDARAEQAREVRPRTGIGRGPHRRGRDTRLPPLSPPQDSELALKEALLIPTAIDLGVELDGVSPVGGAGEDDMLRGSPMFKATGSSPALAAAAGGAGSHSNLKAAAAAAAVAARAAQRRGTSLDESMAQSMVPSEMEGGTGGAARGASQDDDADRVTVGGGRIGTSSHRFTVGLSLNA